MPRTYAEKERMQKTCSYAFLETHSEEVNLQKQIARNESEEAKSKNAAKAASATSLGRLAPWSSR